MYKSRDQLSPSCSSSEELVAYLYDEMSAAEKFAFEDHISGCDVCTAEFAELSLARLGVYEWHRDEFVKMATPRTVIAYGEIANVSWIDSVRAFFASPMGWAPAGGAFALIALLAGVWFMAPKDSDVVKNEASNQPVAASSPVIPEKRPDKAPPKAPSSEGELPSKAQPLRSTPTEPVKASGGERVKPRNSRSVRSETNPPQQAKRPTAAPRLNDFDDEDDDTLRLGDLLAEVDTRD